MDKGNELTVFNLDTSKISKSLDVQLTKDDVVSYQVSQYEDKLEAERDRLTEEMNKKRTYIDGRNKTLEAKAEDLAKASYGAAVKALQKAYTDLGIKKKIELKTSVSTSDKSKVISVTLNDNDSYSSRKNLKDLSFSSEMNAILKDINEVTAQVDEIIDKIATIRTNLSNMNKMERKAKATLVQQMMNNNPELKKLLIGE